MATCFEKCLPVELWQKVLGKVSHGDLCNVMMTSRHMNSMASWARLWTGVRVNMKMVQDNGLPELYAIKRFRKCKEMSFARMKFTSEQLERLLQEIPGTPLESINLRRLNFLGSSSKLLARAVYHLQNVILRGANLTVKQCVEILETIRESTTLVNVDLGDVNFSGVPAELLAQGICRLQIINLSDSSLTTEQCVKLLENSLVSTTLVNVDLSHVNLSHVLADLLAKAICRLKIVNLYGTGLVTGQCVKVLEASLKSSTLINIDLGNINLSNVPAGILAKAVSRLETINLLDTNLTTEQSIKVLETSLSSTTLVNLWGNLWGVNLCDVPAALLAKAVSRLRTANLYCSSLTTDQCIKVFETSLTSTTLVYAYLGSVDLSDVPAELLAKAVGRLQTVNLGSTGLATDQCVKVLETSLSSTTLGNLDLAHANLSDVPADLLAKAVCQLESASLYDTKLTTDQCVELLKALNSSTTLKHINLGYNQFREKVPADLHHLFDSLPYSYHYLD